MVWGPGMPFGLALGGPVCCFGWINGLNGVLRYFIELTAPGNSLMPTLLARPWS